VSGGVADKLGVSAQVANERMLFSEGEAGLDSVFAKQPPDVLEAVGAGGHGALACALTSIFPKAQYTICDLPESLLFSGLYLSLAAKRQVRVLAAADVAEENLAQPSATIELVPNYLAMLAAGGSKAPQQVAQLVGIDLEDPGFWSAGLDLVEERLREAEAAAQAADAIPGG